MMLKYAPTAIVVPLTFNNSWKIDANGLLPLGTGIQISIQVHEPVEPGNMDIESLISVVEQTIKASII